MKEKPLISESQFCSTVRVALAEAIRGPESLHLMPFMSELFSNCFVRKINRCFFDKTWLTHPGPKHWISLSCESWFIAHAPLYLSNDSSSHIPLAAAPRQVISQNAITNRGRFAYSKVSKNPRKPAVEASIPLAAIKIVDFREWCYIFQAVVARLFGFPSRFFPFPKISDRGRPSDAIAERAGVHSPALNNQTKKLVRRKCPWDTPSPFFQREISPHLSTLPSFPIFRIFRRSLMACHKTFITFGISTSGLLPVRSCEPLDTALLFLSFPLSKGTMGG